MADLFTLFGTISVNADSAIRAIENTTSKAGGLAKRFDSAGNSAISLGKRIKQAIVAAGITKAITSLSKATISAYADYEQLVGGVETLFGAGGLSLEEYAASVGKSVEKAKEKYDSLMSAQDAVFANAKQAYRTAGLSANEYMETATSFSASLISSLKGNTEEAARITDMAVIDMADNANKMGTSIGSIQNAYQGFAKQNYTMLDNLKLGYGGTKKEMQRLLKDAQKISGQKYNIKNLDDVIEAIHVIQTEMGITGTTAMEASETIAGSWNATKSAWDNLMIGLSDGNADIEELYANLEYSAGNVVKNVAKVIPTLAKNVVKSVGNLLETAGKKISDGWEDTVYPFIRNKFKVSFGVDLPDWDTLKKTISTKWAEVKAAFDEGGLTKTFSIVLPDFGGLSEDITAGWEKLTEWWEGASENIVQFATDVSEALSSVAEWATGDGAKLLAVLGGLAIGFALVSGAISLLSNPFGLLAATTAVLATNWEAVKNAVDTAFDTTVSWLETNLGKPLETFRANVIAPIAEGWTTTVAPAIAGAISKVDDFLGLGLTEGWNDLTTAIQTAWENVRGTVESVTEAIKNLLGLGNGEEALGGGDPRPWYVRDNPDKYSKSGGEDGELSGEVKLDASEDSEGNVQAMVDRWLLEADAEVYAASNSEALIQAALNAMNLTVPVTAEITGLDGIPGYAKGIDYVREDNQLAYLHKGEAVLTASEAAVWRGENRLGESSTSSRTRRTSASNDQPVTVNLTVNGVSSNPFEIAGEVRNALELLRWQG